MLNQTETRVLPDVSHIDVPFEWYEVTYLMSIPSVDFDEAGLTLETNRAHKRNDYQYEWLMEDIKENGFYNPVFVYPPHERIWADNVGEELGNGHHRVLAAFDLGFTHVPVTHDSDIQWSTSRNYR